MRLTNSGGGVRDARDTIVVAATACAAMLSVVYWASRVGFENPLLPVVYAVGLSLFHIATPLLAHQWLSRVRPERWCESQPFLTLVALALSAVAGLGARATGVSAGPLFAAVGGVSAGIILVRWLTNGRPVSSAFFLGGSSVFGLWAAGVVWGTRYKLPLYWEQFALNANVHHDPIYYAGIANMLRTYGVPSTGIDGIPYVYYHYGSGWLFSQWADLIGIDVMTFYNAGYPIIVIPLFLAALLLLGVETAARLAQEPFVLPLRKHYAVWVAVAAAMIGILPEPLLFALAIWHAHLLISESYLMGLPVFLLVIGTAVAYWRGPRPAVSEDAGHRSPAFLLLFVPLALAATGFLKVSLMVLLLAAGLYTALRFRLFRDPMVWISAVASIVVCGLVYLSVVLPEHNQGIVPFAFIRSQVAKGGGPFFPLLHFAWSWIYIACRLWEERVRTLGDIVPAVRARRLVDAEVVLLLVLLGFLPGEIIDIHGGSAFYFSDVQRWVAVALIIGRMGLWMRERLSRRDADDGIGNVPRPARRLATLRISTLLAALILAPVAATLLLNTLRPPVRLLRENIALRRTIAALGDLRQPSPQGRRALADPVVLQAGLDRAPYYPLITALRRIGTLPESEKRRAALFIPQSYELYWHMFDADDRCTFAPLVAPAFSGVAMIDGMPPRGCEVTDQYNMRAYRPRTTEQSAADLTPAALCARAIDKGFSEVILLETKKSLDPIPYALRCR